MKTAILYTRVSTDEQALNGYSLRSQVVQLENYCRDNNIKVLAHFQDDYSAKTFERPKFNELRQFAKEHKGNVDFLLVVKYDRFSRDYIQAGMMILEFRKLGILVQAIEQPIDEDVPENILIRAIYMAVPEVENARRAMNTTSGMRKAKREGRWVASAPTGYKDSMDHLNKRILVPSEKAPIVIEAFKLYSTGLYEKEEVRKMLKPKGLTLAKNSFATMLRNVVYIGKIYIGPSKNEPEETVEGLHEALIDEDLFFKVQSVSSKSSKVKAKPKRQNEFLPLRGILICSICGNNLTGSASKGNGGKYYYYHCQYGCPERYRAEVAHNKLIHWLEELKLKPQIARLYSEILEDVFNEENRTRDAQLSQVQRKLKDIQSDFEKADSKLIHEEIDKLTHERFINSLKQKQWDAQNHLNRLSGQGSPFKEYCRYGLSLLTNLSGYYSEVQFEIKQKLLGLIFPGKLEFADGKYRTKERSQVLDLLFNGDKVFKEFRKEKTLILANQGGWVAPAGIEPASKV